MRSVRDQVSLASEQVERLVAQRGVGSLGAVWLGHATVLLRVDGCWILTDPVFSSRIGMHVGPFTLGVPRVLPAVAPQSLPRPDIILLSHAHFDHLDRPSLKALAHKHTHVITAVNTKGLVPRGFASVRELAWDEQASIDGLSISTLRPAHWGARTIWDKHRGFNSYLVQSGDASSAPRRILYAGDTAHSHAFEPVGPVDLSIFGIGAYDPWIHAHASPEQVWEMHTMAKGRYLMPMHHSTFVLSDEPLEEPLQRLIAAAGDKAETVVGQQLGVAWTESGDR
jgi:L-ascorbate metabolism protein UlaG (beta-lactamase superfamily)